MGLVVKAGVTAPEADQNGPLDSPRAHEPEIYLRHTARRAWIYSSADLTLDLVYDVNIVRVWTTWASESSFKPVNVNRERRVAPAETPLTSCQSPVTTTVEVAKRMLNSQPPGRSACPNNAQFWCRDESIL